MGSSSSTPWKQDPQVAVTGLVPAVKALISVLREVDEYPALYVNQTVLREAIRRYEHVWVPLLASAPAEERVKLLPPLDVEWVWLCHMLSPVKYVQDSAAMWEAIRPGERNFLIDHKLLSAAERAAGRRKATLLWEFQFPDEPYDRLAAIKAAPLGGRANSSKAASANLLDSTISYDIAAAAGRQMAFHYQVAIMPQYNSNDFRRLACRRYRNGFLQLQREFPKEVWVPTYDIDVMWHAHMLHPRWYKLETEALRGSILSHDDSLNDRSADSKLSNRWEATKETWFKEFGERVSLSGGMWRGNVEAPERVLRPNLVQAVKEVEGKIELSSIDPYLIREGNQGNVNQTGGLDWVHRTDWRTNGKPNAVAGSALGRFTFLSRDSNHEPVLTCHTSHFLTYNAGKPHSFGTVLEIFGGAVKVNGTSLHYPLATAHFALPQTVAINDAQSKKICTRKPSESTLLLRIAGEDFAILCGNWKGFRAPDKTDPPLGNNKKPSRGRPGVLTLRLWLLGKHSVGRWIYISKIGNTSPGLFSIALPDGKISFSLETGAVEAERENDVITGYLLCMSTAAMYVALQPRFEPRGGAALKTKETMYPAWSVSQKEYAVLRGAGGEVLKNEKCCGLSMMRLPIALQNPRSTHFFSAKMDEIGDPNDQNWILDTHSPRKLERGSCLEISRMLGVWRGGRRISSAEARTPTALMINSDT